MNKPFFSLIIPCFNHADYLTVCLNSIIEQNFENWEAIVVNDGSTDSSGILADQFSEMDARIKVIHQLNQGLSSARNSGMKLVCGEWIQFVDADDFLLPNCLLTLAEHLSDSTLDMVWHTGHILVDESGNKIWNQSRPRHYNRLWEIVSKGGLGPPLSLFISKKLANQVGEFDTQLRSAEDWDFWLRAGKWGAFYRHIPEALVAYRYLSNSMSRSPWRMYENTKRVSLRIPKPFNSSDFNWELDLPVMKEIHKKNIIQITGLVISQGKVDEALTFFYKESSQFNLDFNPVDFSQMNSFLTFRYQYAPIMVKKVLHEFRPLFLEFFNKSSFSKPFSTLAISYIFSRHLKNRNLQQFGPIGRIFNQFLDIKMERLKRTLING